MFPAVCGRVRRLLRRLSALESLRRSDHEATCALSRVDPTPQVEEVESRLDQDDSQS